MGFLQWDDSLKLGVDQMDHQHENLINLMNTLFDQNKAGESFDVLKGTLDRLAAATKEHFDEEEKYQLKIGYEKYGIHKKIHEDLLKKFTEHYEKFIEERAVTDGLFSFLSLWLRSHIRGVDKGYADISKKDFAA